MKFKPAAFLLLSLIFAASFSTAVLADFSVGVKHGDWVEYNVIFTGTPPPEHDVVWARMEVMGVEGQRVNATFVSRLANETMLNVVEDVDFATGRLIDMFIIPAGLNAGDSFYAQGVGEITLEDVSVRSAAGATRRVMHAEAEDTQWFWDRASGVVVEAKTANAVYTLDTVAVRTGLWEPQILGLDTAFFGVLVAVAIVVAVVLVFRKKRRTRQSLP
jgi:hypothetical protein